MYNAVMSTVTRCSWVREKILDRANRTKQSLFGNLWDEAAGIWAEQAGFKQRKVPGPPEYGMHQDRVSISIAVSKLITMKEKESRQGPRWGGEAIQCSYYMENKYSVRRQAAD